MKYLIIFLFFFNSISFADEINLKCIMMCEKNSFEDCYQEEFKKWEAFKWKKKDIESQIKSGISNLRITQEKNLIDEKFSFIRKLALENNEYYVYLMAFPETETTGNLQIIGINRTNMNYVLRNITNVEMNQQKGIVIYPEFLSTNNILDSKKITYYLNGIFIDFLEKGRLRDTTLYNCNLEKLIKNKF